MTKLSQNQTHPITHQIRNQTSEMKLQTSVLIIAFAGWHSQWQNSTVSWLKYKSKSYFDIQRYFLKNIHSSKHYPKQEYLQAGPVSGKTQLIHQQFRHRLDCAIHSCTAFSLVNCIGEDYSDRSSLQDHLQ